ncbi:collagenase [Rheinheimera metallidurans]|uniref:collagenase n=1 Tax=Rheinheimera metallidurans TaxID=2925781 RepID=UPI0030027057
MKANTLLLSLLISSGALWASEPITPSYPAQLESDLKHNQAQQSEQKYIHPPRLVSPAEVDKIIRQQHSHDVPIRAITDANTTNQQNSRVSTTNVINNVASCNNPAQLLPLYGTDLVNAVINASLSSCLYGLYNDAFVGTEHFADTKLQTIVEAITARLPNFDGSDATGAADLEKLVTYLRATHWADKNHNFTAAYKAELENAFNQYFAGEQFINFTGSSSRNFMLRYEMLILINSSSTNALPHLARFSEAIRGYANTVSRTNNWGVSYEENGMTQLLTQFFNAVKNADQATKNVLLANPQIINNLIDFVVTDGVWLVGHTREYQWSDTVSELGRLMIFGGAIADTVRPALQQILSQYSYDGTGANGWLNAQAMVKLYDNANCALYGTACNFDLQSYVLSGQHTCSSSLKVRYQLPLSANNLLHICSELAEQEQYFHSLFNTTTDTPVLNDNNTDLEVVIFNSSAEYKSHAGNFFNINTDNGGMYLEGTPSDEGNQARFIAHQAEWLNYFEVWNLRHEYVHYLDGRFNQWGGFNDQASNSVWWSEGLAEYLSYRDTNATALNVAKNKTYQLSEIFQTTYNNGDTTRIYYWGYLATRFMFEQQLAEVNNVLLPSLRAAKYAISDSPCLFAWSWQTKPDAIANNWLWLYDDSEWSSGYWVWTCGQPQSEQVELPEYTSYADILASWGTNLDTEFHTWLDCLVAGNGVCNNSYHPADLDQNSTIDQRDIDLFNQLLRHGSTLSNRYDFNNDNYVDQRDIRAMMQLCTLPRCAISQ